MASVYVNVPETGTGATGDGYRPDVDWTAVERVRGNRLASSGRYVVRVEGPQSELDALVARDGVNELSSVDAVIQALNNNSTCSLTPESGLFDPP